MRTKLSVVVADGTSTVGRQFVVTAVSDDKVDRVVVLCPTDVPPNLYDTTFPGIAGDLATLKLKCITVNVGMGLLGIPEGMKEHFRNHDAAFTCGVECDTIPAVGHGDFKALVLALSPNICVVSHVVTKYAYETVRSSRILEQYSMSSQRGDATILYRTSYWEIQSLDHVMSNVDKLATAMLVDVYKAHSWAGIQKGFNTVLYQFNGNMQSTFNPKNFLSNVKVHGKEAPLSAAPSRTKWHRLYVLILVSTIILLLANGYELQYSKTLSTCGVRVPRKDGTCCGCICVTYPNMCNSSSDFDDNGNRIPFGPSNPVELLRHYVSPVLLTLLISSIMMLLQLCTTRSNDTYMLLSLASLVVMNAVRTAYFAFEDPTTLTFVQSKVVVAESLAMLSLATGMILILWPLYRSNQETKLSRMGYTMSEQAALRRLEVTSALSIVDWQCALSLYSYSDAVFDNNVMSHLSSLLGVVDFFSCVLPLLLIPFGRVKRTVMCIVLRWMTGGMWLMLLYVLSYYRGAYVADAVFANDFFTANRTLYISAASIKQRLTSSSLRMDLATDFRGYYMLFLAACATIVRILALYYTTILAFTIGSSSQRPALMNALFDMPKEKEAEIL